MLKPFRELFSPRSLLFMAALAIASLELFHFHALRPFENRVLDRMVRSHAAGLKPDPDIVIVNIDDYSIAAMAGEAGKWPWPRNVHGDVVTAIQRQKPKAIVFDIFFSERDFYRPESDQAFNEALAGNENVYFPVARADMAQGLTSQFARQLGLIRTGHAREGALLPLLPPLALAQANWRVGAVQSLKDDDGVTRRYSLFTDNEGWLVPSLPARLGLDLGYPVPSSADMLLHWRGGPLAFTQVHYADIYQDAGREKPLRPQNEFKDKIVIIGTGATGMSDFHNSPVDTQYPGVQILATAIDNIRNQRFMHVPPPWQVPAGVFSAMALIWLAARKGVHLMAVGAVLATLTVGALLWTWLALDRLVLMPSVSALLLVWTYFFADSLHQYLAERKIRKHAVDQFSRFVNPHVVKQLVHDGALSGGGESREISVLFSDIRGFTTLSEKRTPEQVVELLNRYFTLQVEVVFRHGGSLDKFIGDCIMAFWGAPLDDPRHAENAVAAALEMADVLQRFKRELGEEDADFDVGIGIHSGPAVVGLIGSDQRREYTAIGDTVNLASRIEGLTKGVSRILVSDETRKLCGDKYTFTPYGSFAVKGRDKEVELYGPQRGEQK